MTLHRTATAGSFLHWCQVFSSHFLQLSLAGTIQHSILLKTAALGETGATSCPKSGNSEKFPKSCLNWKTSQCCWGFVVTCTSTSAWLWECTDSPWHPPQPLVSQICNIHFPDTSPSYENAGRPAGAGVPCCWQAVIEVRTMGKGNCFTS